jgi:glutathione S-transferase
MRDPRFDAPFRLITVPISHFCEKARWALDRLGIPYQEEGHLPLFHLTATALRRRGRTVPVLVSGAGVFTDSTDILRYLDQYAPPEARLYPEGAAGREAAALEEEYDTRLGPATRLLAYYHLLPHRELAGKMMAARVPRYQAASLPFVYPLARLLISRSIGLSPEGAARALAVTREIFGAASLALSDGRRYLTGGRFTAADLAFAALAAPLVMPDEIPALRLSRADWPRPLADVIAELAATPAGRFAARLYREERSRGVPRPREAVC